MLTDESGQATPPAENGVDSRLLLQKALREIRALKAQRNWLPAAGESIALVGVGLRFPGGADTPERFLELLRNGETCTGGAPERGLEYARGGFLHDVDKFDPIFFGIAPNEAASLDPQHRLLLEVCHDALEHALIPASKSRNTPVGLFVGIGSEDYSQLTLRSGDTERADGSSALGAARSMGPGRVAYALGFTGPAMQVDTSCSSSLMAVHLACQSLRSGECEAALAGGVNLILTPETGIALEKMGALAPDGRCKTFDAAADGYARGEGCGIVALKRVSDAVASGDRILAVIAGSAVNHDGQSNGLTAPNGAAQDALIARALRNAGLRADDVQYVETHGTGTSLGDPIELQALAKVLGQRTGELYLGSVKANIGHLESAAGIAGLIKTVLMLGDGTIPGTPHLKTLNPRFHWDRSAFRVPTSTIPWPAVEKRRAGVSAFGMSGTNVHVILEQAPAVAGRMASGTAGEAHLLCISAKTASAAVELKRRYVERLRAGMSAEEFADFAYSSRVGRTEWPFRFTAVAASAAEMADALQAQAMPSEGGPPIDFPLPERAGRRLISLPAYPYERKSYWADYRKSAQFDAPGILCQANVSLASFPFAAEHRIGGQAVFPLSCYVAMALQAARGEWGAAAVDVRDFRIDGPLFLPEAGAVPVQFRADEVKPDRFAFEIHSRGANGWQRYARGECRRGRVADGPPVDPALLDRELVEIHRAQGGGVVTGFARLRYEPGARVTVEGIAAAASALSSIHKFVWTETGARAVDVRRYEAFLGELDDLASAWAHRVQAHRVQTIGSGRERLRRRVAKMAVASDRDPEAWAADLAARFPEGAAEVRLLRACGSALPAVLRGERDPLEVVFSDGDAARVYRDSQGAQAMNAVLAQAVRERAFGRRLRVLEIGGGTGGSTGAILAALPFDTELYLFTDVSAGFLDDARGRFGTCSFFQTAVFDVEGASLPAGEFDLVIAANVIHAARDVRAALRNIRKLLRPDGALLLAEGVAPSRWIDLTFGLTDGWWHFTDADLRPEHPLLSAERWRQVLDAEGFGNSAIARPGSEDGPFTQALISAGAAAPAMARERRFTVPAGGDAERLCGELLALVQDGSGAPLTVIARGAEADPAASAVIGMGLSIAAEHPELGLRMVDIDPAANDAAFEQMLALSGAGVTMWREGKALTRSVRREAAPTACFGARADRTYLIAGGYGGVGLELGLWLVRCGGKNLALIGRNPDGSAAQAAVARLRAEGARVLAVAADIGDEAQTTAALARIRREMPPLAGVIHAAGVYADRLLKNHDAESFAQALHPKVRGAWNLHTLTVGDALDFFILCSSAASMLGAAGLANYSAANAYLDGLAHFRAARGLPALSVNWGPWLGTGMADAVGERRTAQWLAHGITPIRPEEALTALESLLASGAVQAGVFHLAESKAAADAGMRPMLREMPASARRRAMVSLVRDTVAEKLGYQPASALPLREGFFRIGMDSLVALEVVKALRASTGCDLQQTALFAHSDVEALSDYLLGEMFAAAEPSAEEGMPADFERELEGLEALLAATA